MDTDNRKNRDAAFWRERYGALNTANSRLTRQTYGEVERAFELAQRDIQRDIDAWLNHFVGDDGITLAEARKLLNSNELKEFKWDVAEYIKRGRENAISGKWAKELENASARLHISRLEALKIRTQNHLETAFAAENQAVEKLVKDAYKNGYYRTCYELQRGLGVGFDVAGIDERTFDMLVKKRWTVDGRTFFDRIRERNDKMVGADDKEQDNIRIYGRSREEMTKALEQYIKKDVKNAEYCAARIVTTECAFFTSESQRHALSALGCEMYEIYLPLDEKSCDVCREMNGKRFKLSEYVVGSTAPPFHPNCVDGSIISCFEDDFAIDGSPISQNMSFEEWEKKFVKDNGLTNGGDGGIIKGQKLAAQKTFSFEDYDLVSNSESVEKFRVFVAEQFGISHISGIELLENGDTALSIVSPLKQLFGQYGKRFSRISIMDFGNSKTVAETFTNELRLNYQFMNRPDALKAVLDEWERTGYIPSGCNNAAYVGRHEFFHLLTQDLINQPKSKFVTEIMRAVRGNCKCVSENAAHDLHEFTADLFAAKVLDKKQDALKHKLDEIIKGG